jgi:homoserine dehydrogenase
LIGTATKVSSGRLEAHVRLEWIGADHILARIAGEWNALAITLVSGETTDRDRARRGPVADNRSRDGGPL